MTARARTNVLISSAGRRVGLLRLFQAALRDLNIEGDLIAADVSSLAAAWHVADRGRLVPHCCDQSFIDVLLEICQNEDVALVVPTIDTELAVFASNRDRFEAAGIRLLVSSPETVRIAADKRLTNAWLHRNGFPAPRQTSLEDAIGHRADWPLPLIAKPQGGSASLGVEWIQDEAALESLAGSSDYIVETVAAGYEHTVDVLVDRDGRAVCAVPRRRVETRAGEISKGFTVRHADLEGTATRIAECLPGAYGPLNIQMFVEDTGRVTVVEINARFGGGFPLSARAGANYPRWILEEVLDLPRTARADAWRAGLAMARYDVEVFFEMSDATVSTAGNHALSRR